MENGFSPRVEAIQTALKDKCPLEAFYMKKVVTTAGELMKTFTLTPKEMHQVVEIVRVQLEQMFSNQGNIQILTRGLGSIPLYKEDDTQRTKIACFSVNASRTGVQLDFGQILDAPKDVSRMDETNKHMEEVRRDSNFKQEKSKQSAADTFVYGVA